MSRITPLSLDSIVERFGSSLGGTFENPFADTAPPVDEQAQRRIIRTVFTEAFSQLDDTSKTVLQNFYFHSANPSRETDPTVTAVARTMGTSIYQIRELRDCAIFKLKHNIVSHRHFALMEV